MVLFLIFLFGLIIGSFLNAAIFRLHTKESVLFERSHCMYCHHELSAWDLVPVLSFVMLWGKCRYCRKLISWQYPLVELATGLIFVLLALNYGLRITDYLPTPVWQAGGFWIQLVFICFLIVIGVFDFKHYLILDKVVFPALALTVIWNIYQDLSGQSSIVNGYFVSGLLGALAIAGFFAFQYFISRGRWIGFGDVKLGLFLGSLFGLKLSLVMLIIAYFIGAVAGVGLVLFKHKTMGSKLPFGVFLSISAILMLLYGERLSSWYFRLIGL